MGYMQGFYINDKLFLHMYRVGGKTTCQPYNQNRVCIVSDLRELNALQICRYMQCIYNGLPDCRIAWCASAYTYMRNYNGLSDLSMNVDNHAEANFTHIELCDCLLLCYLKPRLTSSLAVA